jgi:hypothetical protein
MIINIKVIHAIFPLKGSREIGFVVGLVYNLERIDSYIKIKRMCGYKK